MTAPGNQNIFQVVLTVKETRTYVVLADSLEEAEDKAMDGLIEPRKVDVLACYVHMSRDVTAEYKDHEVRS